MVPLHYYLESSWIYCRKSLFLWVRFLYFMV